MKALLFIAAMVAVSAIPMSFAVSGVETIDAEGKSFDVSYSVDGEVLAVDVDTESTSLLVGLDKIRESTFEVSFPSELLSAENGEFVVLVDGMELDYTLSYTDGNPTITVPIPEATEEIEIIGTSVVPEFPLGVLAVLGMVSTAGLILSKSKLAIFK